MNFLKFYLTGEHFGMVLVGRRYLEYHGSLRSIMHHAVARAVPV